MVSELVEGRVASEVAPAVELFVSLVVELPVSPVGIPVAVW